MHNAVQFSKSLVAALLLSFLMSSGTNAQDESARFILKLNDNLISSFKDYGSLRSALPADVRDRIDTIELRYQGTEDKTPINMNLNVQINGQNAEIVVDDSLLNTVRNQPVRVPLNGKTFNVVFLRYNKAGGGGAGAEEVVMGDGPNRFVLKITDESTIAGSVVDMTAIELMTNFGKVELTLDQVAGVRFKSDGEDAAVVFLNNGDAITGTPTLGVVNVQTFWGLAEVNASNLRSMSASPSAQYVREATDFGSRWTLKMGTGLAPGN
jgi:hypothetical protein